jgi:hypothetical protein
MSRKLVGTIVVVVCFAIIISSENGRAGTTSQIKVQIPAVHVDRVTPSTKSGINTPTASEHKVFVLKLQTTKQGSVKGNSSRGRSTPTLGKETFHYGYK